MYTSKFKFSPVCPLNVSLIISNAFTLLITHTFNSTFYIKQFWLGEPYTYLGRLKGQGEAK